MFLTPPPQENKDLTGFVWQSWFGLVWSVLNKMEHIGGHWYVTNGNRHALTASAGVVTTTTTVVNTTTQTLLYSYQFLANELHVDEEVVVAHMGSVDAATVTESFNIVFKLGGVTLSTLAVVPKNTTNSGWKSEFIMTIRAEGTSGTFVDYSSFKTDVASVSYASITPVSIDTTIANLFEIYITWGVAKAGNSLSCSQGSVVFNH